MGFISATDVERASQPNQFPASAANHANREKSSRALAREKMIRFRAASGSPSLPKHDSTPHHATT
jgi:hypothetical protein